MQCALYIHLPFCRSKCRYCDFYSITNIGTSIDEYIVALAREWELRTKETSLELTSVFIGGGTPSLLSFKQWKSLQRYLLRQLPVADGAEWTVECNPDSFNEEKAHLLADIGVNRLTFGVQSLDDRELALMGRPHSSRDALNALASQALSRFRSVGADAIYGLPGQTVSSFSRTLQRLLENPVVKHLSAYELTVAEGTPFGRHRSLLPFPAEDALENMVDTLLSVTTTNGFTQYEVSNFSRDGYASRHNAGYWNHEPYIGIGCAAHSYLHPVRSWNISDVNNYCQKLGAVQVPVERSEELSGAMIAREMLFLGLRRIAGIDTDRFEEISGIPFADFVPGERLERFCADGLLEHDPPFWKPTPKGLFFADLMARELF